MGAEKKEDEILNVEEVAAMFKLSPKTVRNYVNGRNPDFPQGFKIGSGPRAQRRWMKSEVDAYLKEKTAA